MPRSNTCAVCACLNNANCSDTCIYSPYFPLQTIEKFKLLLGVFPLDEISKIVTVPSVTEGTRREALDLLYSEAETHLCIQETMRRQSALAEQRTQLLAHPHHDIAVSPDVHSFYIKWILNLTYNDNRNNNDRDVSGSDSSSVSLGSVSSPAQLLGYLNIAVSPDLLSYYIEWILDLPFNDDSNNNDRDVAQQRILLRKRLEELSELSADRESVSSRQEEKGC